MNKNFLMQVISFLEVVSRIKSVKDREIIMKKMASDQKIRHLMKEISINLLKERLPITRDQIKQLKKFKTTFIGLATRGNGKRRKINLIKQTGGALPLLVPILSTLLSTLIG